MTDGHSVTIYQHKGYAEPVYDPYVIDEGAFLVGCSCGWYSGQRNSYEEAVSAARGHAGEVPDEVVGLFGEPAPADD